MLNGFTNLCLILVLFCIACSRQADLTPLPRDGVILAFGDSLTYGTGVDAKHSYPAVLESLSGANTADKWLLQRTRFRCTC